MSANTSNIHGLTYPNAFLASLPVLDVATDNDRVAPLRVLNAAQFADMHLRHLLAHPPDSVLFPFMHGLEGTNRDQNTFFVSSAATRLRAPPYRGLVWVACEDDLDDEARRRLARRQDEADNDSNDDDIDDDDDDDEDEDVDDDSECYSDHGLVKISEGEQATFAMDIDVELDTIDPNEASHMHPVTHRSIMSSISAEQPKAKVQPTAIQTANLSQHDRRVSAASSFSESTSTSVEGSTFSASPSASTDASSYPAFNNSPPIQDYMPNRRERLDNPPFLTCTLRECDLLQRCSQEPGQWNFAPIDVPSGISLRNFGIQVPIYASLSDIVIYSPKGVTPAAIALAERFRSAISRKLSERLDRYGPLHLEGEDGHTPHEDDRHMEGLVKYNVFVLDATEADMRHQLPHLMIRMIPPSSIRPNGSGFHNRMQNGTGQLCGPVQNTINFALREKEEMRELTRATEIIALLPHDLVEGSEEAKWAIETRDPRVGQVFLGNSEDVPLPPDMPGSSPTSPTFSHDSLSDPECPFNSQSNPEGYDICVECHENAFFPSVSQLRLAEEHLGELDRRWAERCGLASQGGDHNAIPVRPVPNANAVVYLPFPSSPPASTTAMASLQPMLRFLEKWLQPISSPSTPPSLNSHNGDQEPRVNGRSTKSGASSRRWSSVSSLLPSFAPFPSSACSTSAPTPTATSSYLSQGSSTNSTARSRSHTSPAPPTAAYHVPQRTRPLKILLYSADGYTESSVPALCLLMSVKGLKLPEAYLELQVTKQRSFFVYEWDLGVLKKVESRVSKPATISASSVVASPTVEENGRITASPSTNGRAPASDKSRQTISHSSGSFTRPPAKSVSFARPINAPSPPSPSSSLPHTSSFPAMGQPIPCANATLPVIKGRQRANTSPWLPSLIGDHLSWFNDARFDGSFPSRVLPFLYLGNLNHASNAYMLHALGITHVVSVGECALVPPPHSAINYHSSMDGLDGTRTHSQFVHRKEGSLWIEEREGRIKVLDIKGVCDDGIDTLEPQLEPICDWIDKAREEGGQVLVHCRVGVSRSATVTIAYVMKHLNIPLVDAYLIVRSRRLSVLIQPNMRLLYNLCGWEVKLAKERVGDDEERLKYELARTLSWPYLSKEVHSLNEKYLH